MKKKFAAIIAAAMTLALASCGGGQSSGDKVKLKIGLPDGDTLTPLTIVEKFKAENPDIEVITDEAPWNDFMSKIKTQIAGGTAPDVFISDSGYTMSLGSMGGSMDMSEKIKSELDTDDYTSALFAAQDADGKVWGVPHGLNCLALYYNEALFDEAGLEYPTDDWTFEDVLEAAKKLTQPVDGTGASPVYGFGGTYSITNGWLPFVLSAGGAPLDETKTKSNFSDPKTIEGIEHMEEFVKAGVVPPTAWYSAQGGMETAFTNGKLAMAFMNSAAANVINTNKADGFRYNVVSMPLGYDGNRNSIYVPNCWIINGKSSPEAQEAAWKWVKFYLSEETQLELAKEIRGGFPIHKKAMEYCGTVESVPANREAFYKNIDETGVTLFENAKWSEWRSKVDKAVLEMFEGRADTKTTAAVADKEVSEILAE